MSYFPLGLILCFPTGQRRWFCREIKLNKGIFLSSLRADLYLYFQLKVHSLELCISVLNSCSWGFQDPIWWAGRPWPELDLPGVPSSTVGKLTSLRLPDPWQSPTNAVPSQKPQALISDNFHYRNQVAPFPILQFPGYFLKDSGYLQARHHCNMFGIGKVNEDIQSQPQINPILQKSVCHTQLYQWDSHGISHKAALGIFPNGTLSYEADNLTCIFIEKYIASHNCILLYSMPKCILCS